MVGAEALFWEKPSRWLTALLLFGPQRWREGHLEAGCSPHKPSLCPTCSYRRRGTPL